MILEDLFPTWYLAALLDSLKGALGQSNNFYLK